MKIIMLLFMALISPVHAAMDITRELVAPEKVAPGQPITVAVTFWTDSWFNPPPEWPAFPLQNGALMTTPLPNQLVTRQEGGVTWSGIRLERQVIGWTEGTLTLPATDLTLTSSGQAPVTVHLPALSHQMKWPPDVKQPDRFLPAQKLTLSQTIHQYYAGKDKILRVGDAVERTITIKANNVLPEQIPQILYAIPGENSQRLAPVNRYMKSGRGEIDGAVREEKIRYLPVNAGTLTLPPVKLRWWDTGSQQWQVAELEGTTLNVLSAREEGAESSLRGKATTDRWQTAAIILLLLLILFVGMCWFIRASLRQGFEWMYLRWLRFWTPNALPDLAPSKRKTG